MFSFIEKGSKMTNCALEIQYVLRKNKKKEGTRKTYKCVWFLTDNMMIIWYVLVATTTQMKLYVATLP